MIPLFPNQWGGSRGQNRERQRPERRGSTLILSLILMTILMSLIGASVQLSTYQTRDTLRYETYKDEFIGAEEALSKVFGGIQFLINNGSANLVADIAAIPPPAVKNIAYSGYQVAQLTSGAQAIVGGQLDGLTLNVQDYRIQVRARKTTANAAALAHPGVQLTSTLRLTYVPLYMYAIFYDPIMEIAPSPPMNVRGRVHSNSTSYFQCTNELRFTSGLINGVYVPSKVTIAGDLLHGRRNGAAYSGLDNGTVWFRNGADTADVEMRGGAGADSVADPPYTSNWLDHRDATWATEATTRWGSNVKDVAHGVQVLSPPIPTGVSPHALIERANPSTDSYSLTQEKFEYKAGLKIIRQGNGTITGTDQAGASVPLTYWMNGSTPVMGNHPTNASLTKYIVTTTSFWDGREQKTVNVMDVNFANMVESGIRPQNSILYVSNENQVVGSYTQPGCVRFINASRLPQGTVQGFTVASDDPVYIKGDYNTVNKTLALVAGDALGILSNTWTDAANQNASNDLAAIINNDAVSANTTTNFVSITGIVPTSGTDGNANARYSGGVENYFRYLENWGSSRTHFFNGSIIALYASTKAVGTWGVAGGKQVYYSPPARTWAWDPILAGFNGPPGTTRVVQLSRLSWNVGG